MGNGMGSSPEAEGDRPNGMESSQGKCGSYRASRLVVVMTAALASSVRSLTDEKLRQMLVLVVVR